MKPTALVVSIPRLPSRSCLTARLSDFISLMKPRVMLLAVFTAVVGLAIAPGHLEPLYGSITILAIGAGAGAAGVLNMWYDADIDALMARTAMRPVPRGRVSRVEALVLGIVLAVAAVALLGVASNAMAAVLLALAIFFYVVVYTAWLKRSTPQNIVIGGAAGALPPVIGWVAVTGQVGLEPLILFLIIFLWTPPHFWALAVNRSAEYARAGIPMLPVTAGMAVTARQILVYSVLLVPVSALPWVLGFAGTIYGAIAAACGTILIVLAQRLYGKPERRAAHRLFVFSIFYLSAVFAGLLIDGGSNLPSSALSWRGVWASAESTPTNSLARPVCSSASARTDEI